ncbi:hypothetical protein [Pseudodesulfovibrio karagichevae]|uniref:Uncharacterized protein n=1 Tax=Pseudodesulfovibrio karagichevae TaxID=3239305 RepID=A0ABV4K137_9BACT
MTDTKSKHISLPTEIFDRVAKIAEQIGAPFSRLMLAALTVVLPRWESGLRCFAIDKPMDLQDLIIAKLSGLDVPSPERALRELLKIPND